MLISCSRSVQHVGGLAKKSIYRPTSHKEVAQDGIYRQETVKTRQIVHIEGAKTFAVCI